MYIVGGREELLRALHLLDIIPLLNNIANTMVC